MPVVFNEPLSFLQRMTEYMEYASLLRVASEQDDPLERMKYVAGKIGHIIFYDYGIHKGVGRPHAFTFTFLQFNARVCVLLLLVI